MVLGAGLVSSASTSPVVHPTPRRLFAGLASGVEFRWAGSASAVAISLIAFVNVTTRYRQSFQICSCLRLMKLRAAEDVTITIVEEDDQPIIKQDIIRIEPSVMKYYA